MLYVCVCVCRVCSMFVSYVLCVCFVCASFVFHVCFVCAYVAVFVYALNGVHLQDQMYCQILTSDFCINLPILQCGIINMYMSVFIFWTPRKIKNNG